MRSRAISFVAAILIGIAACGGSDATTDPNGQNPGTGNPGTGTATNGTFTAQINGVTWNATGTVSVSRQSPAFVGVIGTGLAGSTAYAVTFGLGNVTGPGTFSVNNLNPSGSSMIIGGQTGGWGSYFNGGTGTVTITTLTSNRITGTFSGDLVPGSGNATGTLQVRNGNFTLTY